MNNCQRLLSGAISSIYILKSWVVWSSPNSKHRCVTTHTLTFMFRLDHTFPTSLPYPHDSEVCLVICKTWLYITYTCISSVSFVIILFWQNVLNPGNSLQTPGWPVQRTWWHHQALVEETVSFHQDWLQFSDLQTKCICRKSSMCISHRNKTDFCAFFFNICMYVNIWFSVYIFMALSIWWIFLIPVL